jgi:hypothetical protein
MQQIIRLIVDDSATTAEHVRAAGLPANEKAERVASNLAQRRLEVAQILESIEPGYDR